LRPAAVVVACLAAAAAAGQDGPRLADAVRADTPALLPGASAHLVQVAATVTGRDGGRVRGLAPEAFRVFEDGEARELTHFIGHESERELVVAVDMSASMEKAMGVCRDAVRRFLSGLRPVDHVTLLAFNDAVFTVARREASPEARLRAVDRLRAWGSTAFHDAVLRGLGLLERHRGRRALVLFTDGEDMVSHATADDVIRRIETSAAPVYVVAQGRGLREPGLKRVLDRIASVGGGRAFYTDRIEELDGVFSEIAEDLASQYLLAYDAGEAAEAGRWRSIRVEVAGRGLVVRARQGYRVPARGR
jgi:Ca-activated chloride channel homolog